MWLFVHSDTSCSIASKCVVFNFDVGIFEIIFLNIAFSTNCHRVFIYKTWYFNFCQQICSSEYDFKNCFPQKLILDIRKQKNTFLKISIQILFSVNAFFLNWLLKKLPDLSIIAKILYLLRILHFKLFKLHFLSLNITIIIMIFSNRCNSKFFKNCRLSKINFQNWFFLIFSKIL